MWYDEWVDYLKSGTPLILEKDGVDGLNTNNVYVVNEIIDFGSRKFITLYGEGDKKYGINFFRKLEPDEEIKLRKLKLNSIMSNGK